MKKNLAQVLRKCDETDILELQQAMKVSAWLRQIEIDNGLFPASMAQKLDVNLRYYHQMKNGSYPFTLRTLAKIEAVDDQLKQQRIKEIKNQIKT